jgi:hypothetical protein
VLNLGGHRLRLITRKPKTSRSASKFRPVCAVWAVAESCCKTPYSLPYFVRSARNGQRMLFKYLATLTASCVQLSHTKTIFSSSRGSSWMYLGFSALQYRLFWEFTSPRTENQVSSEKKTLILDQFDHHVQTEETNCKNLFSQMDRVPSKNELLLSTVAVKTILWPFVQMFSKRLYPALVI